MTPAPVPSPPATAVQIVGVDEAGAVVVRAPLGHGHDPDEVLAAHGFAAAALREATRDPGPGHLLTFVFVVVPVTPAGRPRSVPRPRRDADLSIRPGEVARRFQRVAAYAVVTSSRGVLLTQFSDRTNAPGQWGLPGGGLEPTESPEEAVRREIWEETGQKVCATTLVSLQSSHWLGRAPSDVLEDFHAVRVIFTADCPDPVTPVVHDVGGTTSDARWVAPEEVPALPLTRTWRDLLARSWPGGQPRGAAQC
jgi:8-oxo-dGTP diphosphatase